MLPEVLSMCLMKMFYPQDVSAAIRVPPPALVRASRREADRILSKVIRECMRPEPLRLSLSLQVPSCPAWGTGYSSNLYDLDEHVYGPRLEHPTP